MSLLVSPNFRKLLFTLTGSLLAGIPCGEWSLLHAEAAAVRVLARDGTADRFVLQSWTGDSLSLQTLNAGGPATNEVTPPPFRSLNLSEVAVLEFSGHVPRMVAGSWVIMTRGDRYPVSGWKVRDEQVQASWTSAPRRPRLNLPLEEVAGFLFDLPPSRSVLFTELAALQRTAAGHDQVRLLTGDELPGEFVGLDGGLLEFEGALGLTKLEQSRLRAVALDPTLAAKVSPLRQGWVVQLTDGTRVTAQRLEPRADNTLMIHPVTGTAFTVTLPELLRLTQWHDQWEWLAERTPVKVDYTPWLHGRAELRSNQNLRQMPLCLQGAEHVTGIGMTSRMSARYELQPTDAAFQATVGVDSAAPKVGAVVFSVWLDDQQVWSSPELSAANVPVRTPRIPVSGRRTLTLQVDYGQTGDAGDLADWVDACLWQQPEGP